MVGKLILFFLLVGVTLGWSQNVVLYGTVVDEEGTPIANARYYFKSSGKISQTNADGAYSIAYKKGQYDTLIVKHIGFDQATFVPTKRLEKRMKNDSLRKDIVLPDNVFDIVTVTPNTPTVFFGNQSYSVSDFEFDKDENMILLTYEKTLEKGSVLRLLDSNQTVIDSYYIDGNAVELRKDFRDNVHLILEERVYLVAIENNRIKTYLEDRDYYFKYVAPVIDTIGSRIYFSNYSAVYPAFDYLEFDREDSSYTKMLNVADADMMELYRSEFKYVDVRTKLWAHNKQLQTGIDKEIWVGATVFTNSLYYEPIYAPLFKKGNDSIFVFDHYKNYLFKYVPTLGFTDSVRISYHKDSRKSGWEQPLLQDATNSTIYGLFQRNGYTYLSEISEKNGQIVRSFKVHHKYVDKIKIRNGYVYYVFRPYESTQKKYIYQEALKY